MNKNIPLNRRFDNTLLKPESTWDEIKEFVDETLKYNFRNVVVPWYAIPTYVIEKVQGTEVGINVGPGGFPLGIVPTELKMREIEYYLSLGDAITDFDITINISAVKSENWDLLKKEFTVLSERVKKENRTCKFIIETCRLTDKEILKVCELLVDIPTIDFVKTGTGFGPRATSYHDVELINSIVAGKKEIKVSGGVRSLEQFEKFMELGASIFGSSSSLSILKEYEKKYGT
ncbi:MAG: deoxyribose-phosphate aldolase [Kosmotogaceae bacterium]